MSKPHVRDSKPQNAKEIGEIASTYEQSCAIFRNASGNQGNDGERKHRRGDSDGNKKEDNSEKKRLSDQEKEKLKAAGLCFFCKQSGHMSRTCPKKKKQGDHVGSVQEALMEIPTHLDKLCGQCQEKKFADTVPVKIDGQVVNALRDSGCSGIMVPLDSFGA